MARRSPSVFTNSTVLVTGGAGSIASEVVLKLLDMPVRSVRVFDMSEDGIFRLKRRAGNDPRLRLLLGDIRDRERVKMAVRGVDTVVHAAAVKNLEVSEYNVPETCRVNIDGTTNLIECAMQEGVKRFLLISTDKAADYRSLYGATKYVCERLVVWAGQISPSTVFAATRFGNVMETRGNVFSVWKEELKRRKPLSVTDPGMKRFFMHLPEAAEFVIGTLGRMENGCIYVPKMKEYRIGELAEAVAGAEGTRIIGVREGEKMEEVLIASDERAEDCGKYWRIRG